MVVVDVNVMLGGSANSGVARGISLLRKEIGTMMMEIGLAFHKKYWSEVDGFPGLSFSMIGRIPPCDISFNS